MSKYEELANVLTRLYAELSMPIGGHNEEKQSIWMECYGPRLTAQVFGDRYKIFTDTDMSVVNSADDVFRAFIMYFREGAAKMWEAFAIPFLDDGPAVQHDYSYAEVLT